MLLFCPCEHVERVVDLSERAEQPGLGDGGGRVRGSGSQLVEIQIGVAELQEAGTQLVLAGIPILLDEPMGLECLEQAMNGGGRELETLRELGDT